MRHFIRFNALIVAAIFISLGSNLILAQSPQKAENSDGRLIIQGGTIIDVRSGALLPNTAIVMENDRITAISKEPVEISNNDQLLDVTGQYILPGLIDAHVHYEDFAPELFS